MSFVLLKVIGLVIPLRADGADETAGLDVTQHGEEAYIHDRGMTPSISGLRPASAPGGSYSKSPVPSAS